MNFPSCRGISIYSQETDPVISSRNGSFFMVEVGGNTSKDKGNSNSGRLNIEIFPVPCNLTLIVMASFTLTDLISADADKVNDPTAPVKSAGFPSGYGLTFIEVLSVRRTLVIVC